MNAAVLSGFMLPAHFQGWRVILLQKKEKKMSLNPAAKIQ